ncbi:MAG: cryptochrome/photolyase family protein, partial [Burkholderiaceae bacterium]|nr:cryptochrome/photolyase family protein [Burkholderiaceae bacterium]
MSALRRLVLVLGDQLDLQAAAFDGFDPQQDRVWMAEVAEESTHIRSGQPRIALFLSAMRHFAAALQAAGRPLHYVRLDDADNRGSLAAQLAHDLATLQPRELVLTAPGDWRVLQALREAAAAAGLALDVREDRHFFCSVREFAAHARGRKQLRLEFFYREMRRRHGVLLTPAGEPEGGAWNYDADNRKPFGPQGPGFVPPRAT